MHTHKHTLSVPLSRYLQLSPATHLLTYPDVTLSTIVHLPDRLHELLQFVESQGDLLLSNPFHLVGFGNGACIAAAFAQRWGSHPAYVNSIRSLVSVNGFLCPDPQV